VRFYRTAAVSPAAPGMSLNDFLDAGGYGRAFREDHLYPMAAAIWSTPAGRIGEYPASAFIAFCENHRLLALGARPIWRTVEGGSRSYVDALARKIGPCFRLATPVEAVRRMADGVEIRDGAGGVDMFDHVVLASHADQSLRMLADADEAERRVLGAFRYTRNHAILHSDPALMPRRRAVWSSWNYMASRRGGGEQPPAVSYWMNQLQSLPMETPLFVTLNSVLAPRDDLVHREETYEHPLFDAAAMAAQPLVWPLQGVRRTWFCGAWMGAGFHEDGLQAGLAVAEALGGVRRPWSVPAESGRIHIGTAPAVAAAAAEIAA
jgi:predicted NAD/FAD-binding protein